MSASSDLQPTSSAVVLALQSPPEQPAAGWPGLNEAAAMRGIQLSAVELAQFTRYQALLLEWNARFNLTAVTDPAAIEERLFLDSLLLLPTLDALAGDDPSPRIVDIGSGAGSPAIPLAIVRPSWDYSLIEATGKKVTFLSAVIADLGLPHARAIHGRAEEIAREPGRRASWQIATARAVASLPALIELTMPLLEVGGYAVLPKGRDLAAELAAGEAAARIVGARIEAANLVPETNTRIVIIAKSGPTEDDFPRRAGLPARQPLGVEPALTEPMARSRRRVPAFVSNRDGANAGRRNAR